MSSQPLILLLRIASGEKYRRATHKEWRALAAMLALAPFVLFYASAFEPIVRNSSLVVVWAVATGCVSAAYLFSRLLVAWLPLTWIAGLAGITWSFAGLLLWIAHP